MPDQNADRRPRIVISSGEPAGVGPDILASLRPGQFDARLIIAGDSELLQSRAKILDSKLQFIPYAASQNVSEDQIEVIDLSLQSHCHPGELNANNAGYVLKILERCCRGCLDNEFDAMVTAPIQKDIINRAGIGFTGHTEFLADICSVKKPVMLLAADDLRVALVTTHLALRDVADAINKELIMLITTIIDQDMRRRFNLEHPHIKICDLYPLLL